MKIKVWMGITLASSLLLACVAWMGTTGSTVAGETDNGVPMGISKVAGETDNGVPMGAPKVGALDNGEPMIAPKVAITDNGEPMFRKG